MFVKLFDIVPQLLDYLLLLLFLTLYDSVLVISTPSLYIHYFFPLRLRLVH